MKKVMRLGTFALLLFVAVAFSPMLGQQAFAQTTINASGIEGSVLALEGDTVLNLDADLKLKSIESNEFKLKIEGDHSLTVKNKDAKAIDVADLKLADGLEIAEPEGAKIKGGTVVDENGKAVSSVVIKKKAEVAKADEADKDAVAEEGGNAVDPVVVEKKAEPTRADGDGDTPGDGPTPEGEGEGDEPCEHELVETAAKDATCTDPGNIQYWHCDKCNGYFSDEEAKTQINQEDTVIAALGHNFGQWTVATAPTCTAKGSETRTCSRCNTTETREVAALGHQLTHTKAKAATCTKAGNREYWTCSRCGKLFSNASGTTSISKVPTVAKTGHKWGKWKVVKEATTTAKGLKKRVCKHNSKHVQKEEIPQLIAYTVDKGANSSWTKGTKSGLEMIVKRNLDDGQTYDLFRSLSIDDKVVDYRNYSVARDSLKLTLNQTYLENLSVGNHKVKFTFEDGEANTTLTIKAKANNASSGTSGNAASGSNNGRTAQTGDQIPLIAIVSIVLVAAVAAVGVVVARRRMQQ